MSPLLDIALRSAAPLLLGLAACRMLPNRSAAARHAVLALSLAGAAVVVPLSTMAPSWTLVLPDRTPAAPATPVEGAPAAQTSATGVVAVSTAPYEPSRDLERVLVVIWIAGMAVGLQRMATGAIRLRRLAARARHADDAGWTSLAAELTRPAGITRPVKVLITGVPGMIATWGALRPQILLPPDAGTWTADRTRLVLAHEIAHVRRHDWLVQIGADLYRLLFWFNPFAWLAARRLRRESERACDDEVIGSGVSAAHYASHLLDLARRGRAAEPAWATPLSMSMARSSSLEWRITAMLNAQLNRTVPSKSLLAAAAAVIALVVLPASALRLSAQSGPATLTGSIYDVTGAVMPEVAITLEDQQKVRQVTRSDASGRFELAAVNPGQYTLHAEVAGFRQLTTSFELKAPSDWHRTMTLQVGELQETISVSGRRTVSTGSPSGVAEPVRIGGNIKVPRKLRHVAPVYPQAMQDAGLEGVVPLEALIARDGTVSSVRILSAQVHPELAGAAADAVRQWQFSPTLLNGEPVEVKMAVSVQFTLPPAP